MQHLDKELQKNGMENFGFDASNLNKNFLQTFPCSNEAKFFEVLENSCVFFNPIVKN